MHLYEYLHFYSMYFYKHYSLHLYTNNFSETIISDCFNSKQIARFNFKQCESSYLRKSNSLRFISSWELIFFIILFQSNKKCLFIYYFYNYNNTDLLLLSSSLLTSEFRLVDVCSCVLAMLAGDMVFRLLVGDRDRSISIWFGGIGGSQICCKFRRLRRTGPMSSWDDSVMVWRRRVADGGDGSNDDDDDVPPLADLTLGDCRRVIESHSSSLLSNDISSLSTNVGSRTLGLARLAVFGRSGSSSPQNACTRFIFGGQVPVFAAFFATAVLSLSPVLVPSVLWRDDNL